MSPALALPTRPWSRRMEGAATVVFWFVLGVLMAVREISRTGPGEAIEWNEIGEMFAELGLWAALTPLVFWLALRFPAERSAWLGRLVLQIAVGIGIAYVFEYVTRGLFRPLFGTDLPPGRGWTPLGAFTRLRMLDELVVYLAILAAGYARTALFQVQERRAEAERLLAERTHLVAERAQLEAQLAEARLSALRMQLNPHFLFNTLNAVSALVEHDPAGVRTMIARLSSLLRRVLDGNSAAPEVPLREEADFLRDYLDVQRVRLQDRLSVEESWAPGTLDALVPPLLLQPLVENAIGHGIAQVPDGQTGTIRLTATRERAHLVLRVEDNGPGLREPGEGRQGVGIANTRERLNALYGKTGTLALRRGSGWTQAEVRLPFRSEHIRDPEDATHGHETTAVLP
ncbi:MAG: histidine kinase [Bacteroidota bacterium]